MILTGAGTGTRAKPRNNWDSQGTFKSTDTCPKDGFQLPATQSCFIDVGFTPYLPTPVSKSNVLYAGGMTAPLYGSVKAAGKGKKCKKKKGKKRSAAAAKRKCKKKK